MAVEPDWIQGDCPPRYLLFLDVALIFRGSRQFSVKAQATIVRIEPHGF
jgi:hypothetical protein